MSGGDDRSVSLFNPHKSDPCQSTTTTPTALLVKSYEGLHGYKVLDIAISNDKTKFASVGQDKTAFLTDVTTGQTIRRLVIQ